MKKTIRQQAVEWGRPVVGRLHRIEDYRLRIKGEAILLRVYCDDSGTEYSVDAATNEIATIAADDWVI